MKWMKTLSVMLALFSAAIAYYQFYEAAVARNSAEKAIQSIELASISKEIQNAGRDINKGVNNIGREIENLAANDAVGVSEREYIGKELASLKAEIEKLERAEIEVPQAVEVSPSNSLIALMAKLGFSLLFGLSALFVILSKKYEEDTEKWAFSVLSLISGVWIGTIS